MPSNKISELPQAAQLTGDEGFPVLQGGELRLVSPFAFYEYLQSNPIAPPPVSPSQVRYGGAQFPPLNKSYANHGGFIGYPADNVTSGGNGVFSYNETGAFWAHFEIPWERVSQPRAYTIIGTRAAENGGPNTDGISFQLGFYGGAWFAAGDRNHLFLKMARGGTGGSTIKIDLGATKPRSVLIVKSSDGDGTIRHRVFVPGEPPIIGPVETDNLIRFNSLTARHIRVGEAPTENSETIVDDSQDASGTPRAGAPGAVYSHGFMKGTEGTDAQWQDIVEGADIEATLTGATSYSLARDYRGAVDLAAAMTASFTGDTTLAGTVYGTVTKGSSQRQSPTKYLTFDALPGGYVADIKPGQQEGVVPLKGGQAVGLTGKLFARILDPETDAVLVPGRQIGTVADIANATLSAPPMTQWGVIEIWAESDPETVCRLAEWFAVGEKAGIVGQSQHDNPFRYGLGLEIVPTGPASVATLSGQDEPQVIPIIATMLEEFANAKGFAARVHEAQPDRPVCVVDVAEGGTSARDWIDDSNAGRDWSVDEGIAALAGTDKQPCWDWWTAMVGNTNMGQLLDAVVKGEGPDASDHFIFDGTVFDATGYKLAMTGGTRSNAAASPPPGFDNYPDNRAANLAQQRAWARANPAAAVVGPVIPDMAIDDEGAEGGSAPGSLKLTGHHPSVWVKEGAWRLGYRLGEAHLRAKGYSTLQDPSLDAGGATMNGARTVLTIPLNLPNAGSAPKTQGGASINGIEFSEDGGATRANTGYSAAIVGSDLVVTKDSGSWPSNVQWLFAPFGPYSFGQDVELDQPFNGHLYDGVEGIEGGLGLPFESVSQWQTVA